MRKYQAQPLKNRRAAFHQTIELLKQTQESKEEAQKEKTEEMHNIRSLGLLLQQVNL